MFLIPPTKAGISDWLRAETILDLASRIALFFPDFTKPHDPFLRCASQ